MSELNYREITEKNFYEIIKLSNTLTNEQQKCVAPNSFSIAEGSVHSKAYYRGIYLDDTAIGFFMLFIPDLNNMKKDENFDLWRFMIAKDYQNKHYGSKVLDHIISLGKEEGHTLLMTSCAMGKVSPYKFYMKYGFTDTGITDDDGEQSLSLEIK